MTQISVPNTVFVIKAVDDDDPKLKNRVYLLYDNFLFVRHEYYIKQINFILDSGGDWYRYKKYVFVDERTMR